MKSFYPRPDIHLPAIDRATVRTFVAQECAYLEQAIKDGDSGHDVAQDRAQQISEFSATLSLVDQDLFHELYAEEMDRFLQSVMDDE
jgi:hypothetical protein